MLRSLIVGCSILLCFLSQISTVVGQELTCEQGYRPSVVVLLEERVLGFDLTKGALVQFVYS